MTNNSLHLLLEDVKRRFSAEYILTYRLNQDVLENFIGVMRAKGGLHDHPDPLQFRYRLRFYILGKYEGCFSSYGNVDVDSTPSLAVEESLSGNVLSKIIIGENNTERDEATNEDFDGLTSDGLDNLSGYICHKLKICAPSSSNFEENSNSWIHHLSEGGHTIPTKEFIGEIQKLEHIF